MRVAVIGGGAAGFFSAMSVMKHHPHSDVTIYEKSTKLLSKVKISGGGRCNVTNGETDIKTLAKAYPRGGAQLRKAFYEFSTSNTGAGIDPKPTGLLVKPLALSSLRAK